MMMTNRESTSTERHASESQQQHPRRRLLTNVCQLWDSICISAFVIGSALFIFASARNTVTWHLQKFWGASGNYWQSHWETIHGWFGGDDAKMAMLGSSLVSNTVFFGFNLWLSVLDLTGKPQFLLKYKVQPDRNCPVDFWKFCKTIGWIVFNQTVVGLPTMYLAHKVMKWRGCSFGPELPTFHWVLFELGVFILSLAPSPAVQTHPQDAPRVDGAHRHNGHIRPPRGTPHQQHAAAADGPDPDGLSHSYQLAVVLPGAHVDDRGPLWLPLPTAAFARGSRLPSLQVLFVNNFGVLGVLDRLHGTDSLFRASHAYQRHIMLLSLTPLSQTYPDDPKSPTHKAKSV